MILLICFSCKKHTLQNDKSEEMDEVDTTVTISSEKQITAFGFDEPPAAGVINETTKTIAVDLPSGTNISMFTPVIEVSSKALVRPASGVTQNFIQPVIYTVTAEDGSKAQYTVTVNMENIFVKVENASEYSNVVKVKLIIFDFLEKIELASGEWEGDGFKIVLPETINPNYLNSLIGTNGLLPSTLIDPASTLTIIGNKNAKVVRDAYLWGYDISGNRVCNFHCYDNAYPYWGAVHYLIYTDSDVNISGYVEEQVFEELNIHYTYFEPNPILYEWEKTTTYSIECKKGWSILRFTKSRTAPPVFIITEKHSTVPNDRVKWRGSPNY